jgi:deazaflavin-dependent oxidoreductase (nitroreductase family)
MEPLPVGNYHSLAVSQLQIPPKGTRGRRITDVLFKLLMPLAGTQISRYRKSATAEPPTMNNIPLVLLTTIGAKTGRQRTTPLGALKESDGSWIVIGSKGGSITHPAWFINLARNPDKVWLEAGSAKFHVRPELLEGDEYETTYARLVAASPGYAGYRKVTDRVIPLVRLTPIA